MRARRGGPIYLLLWPVLSGSTRSNSLAIERERERERERANALGKTERDPNKVSPHPLAPRPPVPPCLMSVATESPRRIEMWLAREGADDLMVEIWFSGPTRISPRVSLSNAYQYLVRCVLRRVVRVFGTTQHAKDAQHRWISNIAQADKMCISYYY